MCLNNFNHVDGIMNVLFLYSMLKTRSMSVDLKSCVKFYVFFFGMSRELALNLPKYYELDNKKFSQGLHL